MKYLKTEGQLQQLYGIYIMKIPKEIERERNKGKTEAMIYEFFSM